MHVGGQECPFQHTRLPLSKRRTGVSAPHKQISCYFSDFISAYAARACENVRRSRVDDVFVVGNLTYVFFITYTDYSS